MEPEKLPEIDGDGSGKVLCGGFMARTLSHGANQTLYSEVEMLPSTPAITDDQLRRIAAIVNEARCVTCWSTQRRRTAATHEWMKVPLCESCHASASSTS